MVFVFVLYFLTFVATKLASPIFTKFVMHFSLFRLEIFAKIDQEYLEISSSNGLVIFICSLTKMFSCIFAKHAVFENLVCN
jgi:hypothetical protein